MRELGLLALAVLANAQTPPPLGELVDVGGYKVHFYCTGQGSPTVMITGAGFSFDWGLVQPEVAKFTRVCTYDVAGTAWSDAGPPPTCAVRVKEIHSLLQKSEGAYVLVGLSIGALVARLYADQYPKAVAGMVIVDHAFLDPERKSAPPAVDENGVTRPVLIFQTPIDATVEDISHFEKLPERNRQMHRWAMSLNPLRPTVEVARECAAQVKPSLGTMPLAVISTGNQDAAYKRLQQELLKLSPNSRQHMATGSMHAVEIDQPEVVIEAIREIADKVRLASSRR